MLGLETISYMIYVLWAFGALALQLLAVHDGIVDQFVLQKCPRTKCTCGTRRFEANFNYIPVEGRGSAGVSPHFQHI